MHQNVNAHITKFDTVTLRDNYERPTLTQKDQVGFLNWAAPQWQKCQETLYIFLSQLSFYNASPLPLPIHLSFLLAYFLLFFLPSFSLFFTHENDSIVLL